MPQHFFFEIGFYPGALGFIQLMLVDKFDIVLA